MKLAKSTAAALFLLAAALLVLIGAWRAGRASADPACDVRRFEGSRFIVCTFDANKHELRLASRGADGAYLRGFDNLARALGADAERVAFAFNAGMFDDTGAPIGLYVEDGEQHHALQLNDGPGNFHMKPNGVFWQGADGAVHVSESEDYVSSESDAVWATQSGPMLVIDGRMHPRFAADGASRYVRNGVGVRNEHEAYFVISSGAVSFGRFARFFRDILHTSDALFLDGAVSSLWAPAMNRRDTNHEIGPIIVVLS